MEYVLKTNSLCKNYGHFKALNGLSMNVPKGSIYGLIGKNGAGKTTLIRLICGLQEPTSGDYVLYGKKHIDKDITISSQNGSNRRNTVNLCWFNSVWKFKRTA